VTGATLTPVAGGVAATDGISAAGIAAGLKPSGAPDMAMVAATSVINAAAVQTRNQVLAAPVQVTARHVANGKARAVLLNAGSANVCTGPEGMELAERSAKEAAGALGCDAADVLLCSTGVIGVPIPEEPFLAAIPSVVSALSGDGGARAARAIMTTDTTPKEIGLRVDDGTGACTIGGMAKGSGMIAPAMATMLCVLTTDAPIGGPVLKATLKDAVARTFGRISVDDCMSTNDAVILLATGTATQPPSLSAFAEGLTAACASLAEAIVRDGEGAKKLVRLRVTGARNEGDAAAVGRAVAGSALVRTAIAGEDPNWGRILAAMGAGPVTFEPQRVAVTFGGVTVCRFGVATSFDRGQAAAALRGSDVTVTIDLGLGAGEATFLTCDLTHDYITINAEYTT
jgi:glutamate N-acetyltransferase/amino-acid N-acetyltransferase